MGVDNTNKDSKPYNGEDMVGMSEQDMQEQDEATAPKTGIQYAWWDNEKKEFCNVYSNELCVKVCFADGGKSKIAAGEGEIVKVKITSDLADWKTVCEDLAIVNEQLQAEARRLTKDNIELVKALAKQEELSR